MLYFQTFMVFLTLLARVRLDDLDPTPPPIHAQATLITREHRFFSGEDVEMACSVPVDPLGGWTYEWFKDKTLVGSSERYRIKNAVVLQSGKYTCKGQKAIDDWPYNLETVSSEALDVTIDGGWAILRTPFDPSLIDEAVTLTCRVRNNALVSGAVFYKDDVEIRKQQGGELVLSKLALEDNGAYSCTATWFANQEYQSSQSLLSNLIVLDKLETPRLESSSRVAKKGNKVEFKCITKVNAKEPNLNVEYFFLKDGDRLGPSSTQHKYIISYATKDDAGVYTCRVRIRSLNLERWSKGFQLRFL